MNPFLIEEEKIKKTPLFSHREALWQIAVKKAKKEGLWLEFGVGGGYSLNCFAKMNREKQIFGFDSFQGLPEKWSDLEKGHFIQQELPKIEKNAQLVVGLFEDTIPLFFKNNKEKTAFVHIDCDIYSSTKTIFQYLGKFLEKGTIIVFDELFGYPDFQNHEMKAFLEFLKENPINYEYFGHCEMYQAGLEIK